MLIRASGWVIFFLSVSYTSLGDRFYQVFLFGLLRPVSSIDVAILPTGSHLKIEWRINLDNTGFNIDLLNQTTNQQTLDEMSQSQSLSPYLKHRWITILSCFFFSPGQSNMSCWGVISAVQYWAFGRYVLPFVGSTTNLSL